MTTLIIKSDSEKKTSLLIRLAEELGLEAKAQDLKELTAQDMIHGIGRKLTDEELINYLLNDQDASPLNIEEAFSKYLSQK